MFKILFFWIIFIKSGVFASFPSTPTFQDDIFLFNTSPRPEATREQVENIIKNKKRKTIQEESPDSFSLDEYESYSSNVINTQTQSTLTSEKALEKALNWERAGPPQGLRLNGCTDNTIIKGILDGLKGKCSEEFRLLDLSYNAITDKLVMPVVEVLRTQRYLEGINLSHNQLGRDEPLAAAYRISSVLPPSLKNLDLSYNALNKEACKIFKEYDTESRMNIIVSSNPGTFDEDITSFSTQESIFLSEVFSSATNNNNFPIENLIELGPALENFTKLALEPENETPSLSLDPASISNPLLNNLPTHHVHIQTPIIQDAPYFQKSVSHNTMKGGRKDNTPFTGEQKAALKPLLKVYLDMKDQNGKYLPYTSIQRELEKEVCLRVPGIDTLKKFIREDEELQRLDDNRRKGNLPLIEMSTVTINQ